MKVYRLERIARDVRIVLDQNMASASLAETGDVDTLTLDEIIVSKVTEGVARVHSEAPSYLLDGGNNFGDSVYWNGDGSGWVLLPEDFMRLVVFEMSDWERAVYHAISEDDEEYELQSCRFKGLRGTPQKPVCAIVVRPEGRALEFYSCRSKEAQVSKAVYMPYPDVDPYGGIGICRRCYKAVVYTVASLVLFTYGDADKGNALSELAKTALI